MLLFLRFREIQELQKKEERIFSSLNFQTGFNHNDIKLTVWKRLQRKVLPGTPVCLTLLHGSQAKLSEILGSNSKDPPHAPSVPSGPSPQLSV